MAEEKKKGSVLDLAEEFLLADDNLSLEYETWVAKNCDRFSDKEDNKTELQAAHQEFSKLLVPRLQAFLKTRSWTTQDLFKACEAVGTQGNEAQQFAVKLILAINNVDILKKLMLEEKLH